jgi:hypothetical protein
MRQGRNSGSVVLPGQLLQVLRPFVALNDDFDRRFVQTFSIPEFRASSSDYSQTATRVLSYLNSLNDLPQATAVAILRNELLMRRVRTKTEGSADFTREIDLEVVATNKRLSDENLRLTAELADARRPAAEAVFEPPATPLSAIKATEKSANHDVATARIAGLVLGVLLLIVAGICALAVTSLQAAQADPSSGDPTFGRLRLAGVGAFGLLAFVIGVLDLYLGTVRGRTDFVIAAFLHPVGRAAVVAAVVAGLALFFGLA